MFSPIKKNLGYTFFVVLLSSFALTTQAFAVKSIEVEASIPKNITDGGSLSMTITVKSVQETEKAINSEEEPNGLIDKLEIYFSESDDDKPIATANEEIDGTNFRYYWLPGEASVDDSKKNSDGTYDIVYTLTVQETTNFKKQAFKNEIKDSGDKKSIKGRIVYDANTDDSKPFSEKFEIFQNFNVPAEAPSGFKARQAHRSIVLEWTQNNEVKYTDGETGKAPSLALMVFKDPVGSINLDSAAYIASLDDSKDNHANGCQFTPPTTQGASCISCTDESQNIYFRISDLKEIEGSEDSALVANDGEEALSKGLDIDSEYTLVMSYQEGTKRTACYTLSPGINLTWAEFNGEKEGSETDIRCFIATAAYGTPFDKHVADFRWFRDSVLLSLPLGQDLVELYYKISPPLAEIISDSESLRSTTRGLLYIPALGVHTLRHNTGIFLLLLVLLVGLVVISSLPKNKGH